MRISLSKWRIPLLALVLLAVVLVALLAIRGGGGKKVEAGEWVTNVCGLVVEYEQARAGFIQQAGAVDPKNPQASKNELSRILDELSETRLEFRDDVENAGTPDVDGGKEVREAFLERFEAGGEIIARLREGAKTVDVSSPQNFQRSVQNIVATSGQLPDLRANLESISQDEPEARQIIDLLDKNPQCAAFLYMN